MKKAYIAPEMQMQCMEMESACLVSSPAVLDDYADPGVEGLGRDYSEEWDDEDEEDY